MVFTKADGMALQTQWHKLFSKLLGSEDGKAFHLKHARTGLSSRALHCAQQRVFSPTSAAMTSLLFATLKQVSQELLLHSSMGGCQQTLSNDLGGP